MRSGCGNERLASAGLAVMNTVFGHSYAETYDLVYREKDYEEECRLLVRLFQQWGEGPVRRILDLGCGTGNHAVRLAARGFEVVGVDRSAEMLRIAQDKIRESGLTLRLRQSDIREVQLDETFDAALMMFAVLGYQERDADVVRALQAARRHLRPKGLLVFDIWHGPAVLAQGPDKRVRKIPTDHGELTRISSGTLDTARQICTVEITVQLLSGARVVQEATERHSMRYFFPTELERFLAEGGFRLRRLGGFPEFDAEPDEGTWNVMGVAEVDPRPTGG